MLTLANVKEFKKELDKLQDLTTEMLSSNQRQRLFNSTFDKEISEKELMRKVPQDYFHCRLFDKELILERDFRTDEFCIVCIGYSPNFETNCIYKNSKYYTGVEFDGSLLSYKRFLIDLIHQYFRVKSEELMFIW